jgi:hypothetical protein
MALLKTLFPLLSPVGLWTGGASFGRVLRISEDFDGKIFLTTDGKRMGTDWWGDIQGDKKRI